MAVRVTVRVTGRVTVRVTVRVTIRLGLGLEGEGDRFGLGSVAPSVAERRERGRTAAGGEAAAAARGGCCINVPGGRDAPVSVSAVCAVCRV